MSGIPFKVVVTFERREDGGLRAHSEDVPGLCLSSADVDGLLADVPAVLSAMLSYTLDTNVEVVPLISLPDMKGYLRNRGIVPSVSSVPGQKEFVAYAH